MNESVTGSANFFGPVQLHVATNPADLEAFAVVLERVGGYRVAVSELQHDLVAEPDALFLVARAGGEVVGSGVGKRSSTQGCLYAMARVLPDVRGRGGGSALYAALSDHARRLGLGELWGRVEERDEAALNFVERRGFHEFSREVESILTLAGAPPPVPDPPRGVAIVSLGERPDLAEAAHAVDAEAVPDIPVDAEFVAPPFERWHARTLEGPGALPHACMVALAGDEVIGYAALLARQGQPGTAEHQLTGVRRAWRRRGVATALKRAQVAWAKANGFERLVTYNDEANAPMRGINARLGYVPQPALVMVRGPLAPAGG